MPTVRVYIKFTDEEMLFINTTVQKLSCIQQRPTYHLLRLVAGAMLGALLHRTPPVVFFDDAGNAFFEGSLPEDKLLPTGQPTELYIHFACSLSLALLIAILS